MAQLLLGTTVDGNIVYHTGNLDPNDFKLSYFPYDNRDDLRLANLTENGTITFVENLGLFVYDTSVSLFVDDDETCFDTGNGKWILILPSSNLLFDEFHEDEQDEDIALNKADIASIKVVIEEEIPARLSNFLQNQVLSKTITSISANAVATENITVPLSATDYELVNVYFTGMGAAVYPNLNASFSGNIVSVSYINTNGSSTMNISSYTLNAVFIKRI